jgi:glycosyltransferase 2 family protein
LTRRLLQIAKFGVPIVITFFIGRTIIRNWQQVRETDWEFQPLYLVLSIALTAPFFAFRPYVWKVLVRCFGYSIPYSGAFRLVRQADMSRYVPGTVWQYVSRVYLAARWDIPVTACLGATLVEMVLLLLSSIPLVLWSLQDVLPLVGRYQGLALLLFLFASLFILHPRILSWWAARLSRRANQPSRELRIHWSTLAAIGFSYLLVWVLLGLGLACFVAGVMNFPPQDFLRFAGNYVSSWIASIFAVMAPAGIGVRDGIFGLLLSGMMPLGAAFTVALAVRLWITVLELVWLMVALALPSGRPAPQEEFSRPSLGV